MGSRHNARIAEPIRERETVWGTPERHGTGEQSEQSERDKPAETMAIAGVQVGVMLADSDGVAEIVKETVEEGEGLAEMLTVTVEVKVRLSVTVADGFVDMLLDGEIVLLDVGAAIHSSTINPPPPGGQYQHQGPPILGPSPPLARIPP